MSKAHNQHELEFVVISLVALVIYVFPQLVSYKLPKVFNPYHVDYNLAVYNRKTRTS